MNENNAAAVPVFPAHTVSQEDGEERLWCCRSEGTAAWHATRDGAVAEWERRIIRKDRA